MDDAWWGRVKLQQQLKSDLWEEHIEEPHGRPYWSHWITAERRYDNPTANATEGASQRAAGMAHAMAVGSAADPG